MTETCSQVVALPPDKAEEKIGSAGLPLAQVNLRIQSQSLKESVIEKEGKLGKSSCKDLRSLRAI